VIYDPARHRYFAIGKVEFEILRRWQPQPAARLIERVEHETGLSIAPDYVEKLLTFLNLQNLLQAQGPEALKTLQRQADQSREKVSTWLLHRYLFFRVPLFHPDNFLTRTEPYLRFLFSYKTLWGLLGCAFLGIYLVSRQFETFIGTFPYFFSLPGIITFAVALFFGKIFHELGHAYTSKYYGLRVPTIGVAFMVLWPVLYTDTTDAWKLTSHRQRLHIGAAGVINELALAAVATLLWSFLPDGPLRSAVFMLATATWLLTLLVNLNPFMRFDGYYLLADWLGVSNLQERSFALARWWLREKLFGLGDPPPENFPPKRRKVLLFYAYGTWLYRFFLFIGIAVLVYYLFFKLAGIFLMLVEIIWFVARPIARELAYWWKRRSDMRWNVHTGLFLLSLGALTGALVIPWQSDIHVPAVYRAEHHQQIYPPAPGRLAAVHVQRGQRVAEGDLLFELEDPDLSHKLASAQRKQTLLELQLELAPADREYLEKTHELRAQLAEALAEAQKYQAQLERLRIRAPFTGEIAQLDGTLESGRWVNPEMQLALLVDRASSQLTAYVEEDDISLLAVGNAARFYPQTLENPPLDARIVALDSANIAQLQSLDHYVASEFGGELAVRRNENRLIPAKATYRVRLKPEAAGALQDRVERGVAVLTASERKNLLQRAWTMIGAVLVRESGF
jgi:putative peptide zinc metalloprotease protein